MTTKSQATSDIDRGPQLFECLGGTPALEQAVDQLFEQVEVDPLLSLYFDRTDLTKFKPRFRESLAELTGAPASSFSQPMIGQVHAGNDITDLAFDQFVTALCESFERLGIGTEVTTALRSRLNELKSVVVGGVEVPAQFVYQPQPAV